VWAPCYKAFEFCTIFWPVNELTKFRSSIMGLNLLLKKDDALICADACLPTFWALNGRFLDMMSQ
jgi:hypothetical protein